VIAGITLARLKKAGEQIMIKVAHEKRPDVSNFPAVYVGVILGGATGFDGCGWSPGILTLRNQIKGIPGVQVSTWNWGEYKEVFKELRSLPPQTKRVLVGYSGGGWRIVTIARMIPSQTIDLVIGYDPSPTRRMKDPLTSNVRRAIFYHCLTKIWVPGLGLIGGGLFFGIDDITRIDLPWWESHFDVQKDQGLHNRTCREIRNIVTSLDNAAHVEVIASPPKPVGSPGSFSTRRSTSYNNNGRSTTEGLRGTLQRYDDGSTVIEATEALSAYRKDTRLNGSLTAFCRRVRKDKVITVQQANYSYKGRQLALSYLYLQMSGIPIETPPGFEGTAIRTVKATRFGKNDEGDEGTGSPYMGLIQTNSEIFGASIKLSVMKKIFGPHWYKNDIRLAAMIEVYFTRKQRQSRMVRVPLVDVGPGQSAKSRAEVDLTWACDHFLGTQGGGRVQYRLLVPSKPQARGFPPPHDSCPQRPAKISADLGSTAR
jgi:hypothetical protein